MKAKRVASLLLCLIMALSLLPAAALAAEPDEVIEITTAAQLKELAAQVNAGNDQKGKYYLLKNDLDLGGSNFFKLRDLGAALNFDVDYDDTTATMIVRSR